jgi:hypothetical protein
MVYYANDKAAWGCGKEGAQRVFIKRMGCAHHAADEVGVLCREAGLMLGSIAEPKIDSSADAPQALRHCL